jgi:transposase
MVAHISGGGMGRTYRRYSTEFKLRLVERFLAGEGNIKQLTAEAGIERSLLYFWVKKYERGELTVEAHYEADLQDAAAKIAALERKVGQLTMELDFVKRGLIAVPATNSARSSITSGPKGCPEDEGAA